MTIEVYESKSENAITCIIQGDNDLLPDDAVLLRTIHGNDWDDCMKQHYELMGWNPYIPF
jgi:hypothetical protein